MRAALSVTIAAALLAAHVVLLTLYLNPSASLRGDGGALALALFLPDFVLAAAALGIGVVLTRVFVREARARRRPASGRRPRRCLGGKGRPPGPPGEGLPSFREPHLRRLRRLRRSVLDE